MLNRISLLILLIIIVSTLSAMLYLHYFIIVFNQQPLPSDTQQVKEIITDKEQREIIVLLANKSIPEETKKNLAKALTLIAQARQDINEDRKKLLNIKETIYTHLWTIFTFLIILGGIIGSMAYRVMKEDLFSTVGKNLDDRIDKRIKYGSLLAEAMAYQGMSYTFYKHYNNDFKYVIEPTNNKNEIEKRCRLALRDIEIAKIFSNRGFDRLEDIKRKEKQGYIDTSTRNKNEILLEDTYLLNDFVYHCTAERVLSVIQDNPGIHNPWEKLKMLKENEEFSKGLDAAKQLLRRCDDSSVNSGWHAFYDSAGFCLAVSSCKKHRQKGREKLIAAIEGRGPAGTECAPYDRRLRMWEEHNERFNLGLSKPKRA